MNSDDSLAHYTIEDFKSLKDYLEHSITTIDNFLNFYSFKAGLEHCGYDAYLISIYFYHRPINFKVLSTELHNVPLYLNDKDHLTEEMAKWRLFIGK